MTSPALRIMARLLLACVLIASIASAAAAPKKVLLVTVTDGFYHTSTVQAEEFIPKLGAQTGDWTVDLVKSGPKPRNPEQAAAWTDKVRQELAAKMNPEALKGYDAAIFASTTGILPLPDKQAFLDWVKSGKGFVGIHAASDTFHGERGGPVDPYIEMVGGEFATHGRQVTVECFNIDPAHPSSQHLGKSFTLFDEIYEFKNYAPEKVHNILTMNKHPQNGSPGIFAVAWGKDYGQGRVFYTSLGHREDVWDPEWKERDGSRKNPPEVAVAFQKHLIGGIRWALGLVPGNTKPQDPAKLFE